MKTNNQTYRLFLTRWLLLFCLLVSGPWGISQSVSVSATNALPDPSAMLDVQSVTKGMLIPRMTEPQRNAIASPANGLIVYQTSNTSTSRRGFWYYDATTPEWVHLGRGEYAGIVEQQPAAVVNNSHPSGASSLDVGQTELTWFPPFSTPPSVVVIPEYTVVGTPPDITDYCQPSSGTCNPGLGRMNWIRIYYPDPMFTAFVTSQPPLAAIISQPNCSGANNVVYKYLPFDGLPYQGNQYLPMNNFIVDFCNESGDIAFAMRAANSNQKSFSFWADLNQDGDFSDPGELLDTRSELNPNNGFTDFLFGTGQPSYYPPITIPPTVVNGVTKLRIMIRDLGVPHTNPCFAGDLYTKTYDFDMQVICGGGGTPYYPSELNWCNVDDITPNSARISCFDEEGSPADLKFHYKIISHD